MTDKNVYCTFYLLRHGEAEGNAEGLMQGHYDVPLTEKGRTQVKELSEKLKDINFDKAYSSDLLRTKQTAEIIVMERQLAVQTSELIRERNYGKFEGKSSEEYESKVKKAKEQLEKITENLGKTYYDLIGVENDEKLISRVITFFCEIAVANVRKTILVAAHGGLMRTFIRHVDPENFGHLKTGTIRNGAYIKFQSDGVDFRIIETSGIETSGLNQ